MLSLEQRERHRISGRKYFQANKDTVYSKAQAKRAALREFVASLKEKPCADCVQSYPWYVMQFDHTGTDKVSTISGLIANFSSKIKILEEIAKCDLVCANCHFIRTYLRNHPPVAERTEAPVF